LYICIAEELTSSTQNAPKPLVAGALSHLWSSECFFQTLQLVGRGLTTPSPTTPLGSVFLGFDFWLFRLRLIFAMLMFGVQLLQKKIEKNKIHFCL